MIKGATVSLVSFTNNSSGYNLDYIWDFGDGSSSVFESPTHMYINNTNDSINDTVSLIIESPYLCRDTHKLVFTVYPYIDANFAIDTTFGCTPFDVVFQNNSHAVDTFIWDFGDGRTDNSTIYPDQFTLTYTNTSFTDDSIRTVRLITKNRFGCSDTIEREITVYKNIEAGFFPENNIFQKCDTADFKFHSTSQGADEFFWGFGDGASSTQKDSAYHIYSANTTANTLPQTVSLFVLADNKRCSDYWDTTVVINPYNKAIFSFDDAIGCSPYQATFNNGSVGTNNDYYWETINGTDTLLSKADYTTTFSNPTPNIRNFEVKLTAENIQGCKSTYKDTISAYPEITADFSIAPSRSGCHPYKVQFSNLSVNNTMFEWDFGDNSSSVLENPSHKFYNLSNTKDTTYYVSLKAFTEECADSITDSIKVNHNPVANFETDVNTGCPPFFVEIYNKSTGADTNYWKYGNSSGINNNDTISHAYLANDTLTKYTLTLINSSSEGCRDTTSTIITSFPEVTAEFTYDSAGCHRFKSDFANLSTNAIKYNWDFGDGGSSSVKNPSRDFVNIKRNDTNYTVQLISESEYGCSDTVNHTVTVFPTPNLAVRRDPTLVVFYNKPLPEIEIINETSHRTKWTYEWDFDDGSYSSTKDSLFLHTYNDWGPKVYDYKYFISAEAYNPQHTTCRDTIEFDVIIKPPVPEASIVDIEPDFGCEPLNVTFNVLTEYEDSIFWDFDDGNFSREATPTHTFDEAGYYNVKLTVYGDGGINFDNTTISVFPSPKVDFIVEPSIVQLPDALISASNQSLYGKYFLWDFGDGNISRNEDPVHTYQQVGQYPVKLVVTSENGCRDSLTKESEITVLGEGVLKFPTAFNPVSTGSSGGYYTEADINLPYTEIFRPYWKGINTSDYQLVIYNRWGEQIFETANIYQGWDGYYNGKLCNQGVYVWKVKYKTVSGIAHEEAGNVTLIR